MASIESGSKGRLSVVPLTLKQANALVASDHRHHGPAAFHRFSLGAMKNGVLVGAVVVGRPVARGYPQYEWCEVSRLVTDGEKNACSFLYGAAAKVAQNMGFERIQTYILDSEPGTSLRAVGWVDGGLRKGKPWPARADGRRRENEHPTTDKRLFFRELKN